MATQVALMDTDEWLPSFGFGDRMRLVRRRKHRSQDEMAALLGVKKVTYASWEAGRTPSLDEVQVIARRLYLLDRVPQWWTLGADEPSSGSLRGTGARSSTDRASDYGSGLGLSPFRAPGTGPRRERRRRSSHVVPLTLVSEEAVG